jgi:hypothetical protein
MNIKPIETVYNGYHFRSRLEARWAVFFDAIGWEYQYEAEGFTDGKTKYLPDFYMPITESFIEIKPLQPSEQEIKKALMISKGRYVEIYWGDPWYRDEAKRGMVTIADGKIEATNFWFSECLICGIIAPSSSSSFCDYHDDLFQHGKELSNWSNTAMRQVLDNKLLEFLFLNSKVTTQFPSDTDNRAIITIELQRPKVLDILSKAYQAARSARFEFGESGRGGNR